MIETLSFRIRKKKRPEVDDVAVLVDVQRPHAERRHVRIPVQVRVQIHDGRVARENTATLQHTQVNTRKYTPITTLQHKLYKKSLHQLYKKSLRFAFAVV